MGESVPWTATLSGDRSGQYYRYVVEVFVRGVGVVRNLVTDPYSLGLTTDLVVLCTSADDPEVGPLQRERPEEFAGLVGAPPP